MAKRNYKAEYARRKAKALAEGFSSPRVATRRRAEAKATGQAVRKESRARFSPSTLERRSNGWRSKKALDDYIAKNLLSGRSKSAADLSRKKLQSLQDEGYSLAQIASLHRQAFSTTSRTSIKNMDGDKWIRQAHVKTWYVDILGMYTSKEYDEKYGLQA